MPSLYRWKKQGMVAHVRKGIYLPSDLQDKFRIACNAVEEGCLVYHAALEYYSLQTQEFNWLYVHSTSIFRTFTYQGESYVYKPVKFLYKPLIVDKDISDPGNIYQPDSYRLFIQYKSGWRIGRTVVCHVGT